jgi:3'-phosphoadenosine 5'-phosphosulfate sulfotransferase (PAPS reductase)/FAD synthetase
MRHIIPISGKDSLATALVQIERQPDLPYELMFNPTGAETPEVDEWLCRVEKYLGLPIVRVGNNLENIIDEQGILPSINARYCTRLAKIYPMEDWIGGNDAVVYYGIRADERRTGYLNTKKPNITPAYPLIDVNMGLTDVWALLENYNLLPPLFFWQSMFDMVHIKLGEFASVLDKLNRPTFYSLFAGRSRANCYFCFFQRTYEWVWLLETHPQLFWNAVEIEENTGASGYNWRPDKSLRAIASDAHNIKKRRAQKICDMLIGTLQSSMPIVDNEQETPDLLQVVSCGLFCGK